MEKTITIRKVIFLMMAFLCIVLGVFAVEHNFTGVRLQIANNNYTEEYYKDKLKRISNLFMINREGQNLLHRSVILHEEPAWIIFLIKSGLNTNLKDQIGNTPLHYVYKLEGTRQNGYDLNVAYMVAIMKILIEGGAKVDAKNDNNETPLLLMLKFMEAPLTDRGAPVQFLIEAGANVNVQNKDEGNFPLFYSSLFGEKVLGLLLDAGANTNLRNKKGQNALFIPCSAGNYTAVVRLLNAGVKLNLQDIDGRTPLMYATLQNRKSYQSNDTQVYTFTDIAKALLSAGAKINTRDKSGKTALIYAASFGNVSMVYTLIKAGADVNIKDKEGKTALDYARQAGHKGAVYYLEKAL